MGHNWDAIVVGAGPAGSALATLLARDGWRVALLDASNFPRPKLCGEHLAAGAQPLLDALGLAHDVRCRALPIEKVSLVASPRHRLTIEASARGLPAPVALSRYRFDELLVNLALQAGVDLRPGCRVRTVLVERGAAEGVLANDVSRQEPAQRLTAPVIIAADGRQSVVVRRTGKIARRGPPLVGFKRHFPPGALGLESGGNELAMYSLPGGYVGVAPVEDGSLNVCGVMPRGLLSGAAGRLNDVLGDWMSAHPSLRALVSQDPFDDPWLTMANVSTQFARSRVRGVLYVGDALGTIEPFTGQGMTMALASAWIAYRVLAEASPARPPSAWDQQRNAAIWQSLFRRPIQTASVIAQLLRRPRMIQAILRVDCLRANLGARIFQAIYHSIPVAVSRLGELTESHASMPPGRRETASCSEQG